MENHVRARSKAHTEDTKIILFLCVSVFDFLLLTLLTSVGGLSLFTSNTTNDSHMKHMQSCLTLSSFTISADILVIFTTFCTEGLKIHLFGGDMNKLTLPAKKICF